MPSTGIGALIGLGLGAFGKRPEVPDYREVVPGLVQKRTIADNSAAFADIAKLATSVNTFNQDQLNVLIDRVLGPGVRAQFQSNLAFEARGELPQDVMDSIYRSRAGRDASGNAFAGGGFSRNAVFRDIVGSSYDITNKALSSAESWLAKAAAPTFDVTSMFFTPQQRLAQENLQQERQFSRDVMAAGVAAAPDPGMAALAQGIDSDISKVENAALSYAGMAAGGGLSGASNPTVNTGLGNGSFGWYNPSSYKSPLAGA